MGGLVTAYFNQIIKNAMINVFGDLRTIDVEKRWGIVVTVIIDL